MVFAYQVRMVNDLEIKRGMYMYTFQFVTLWC